MFGLFRRKQPEEERARTEEGLRKTRAGLLDRMARFFLGMELSQEVWDEFEEGLIAADVGVETSLELVERVRARAEAEGLGRFHQALDVFREEVERLLTLDGRLPAPWDEGAAPALGGQKPFVVLVVGVNGVGKTTSIAKLAHLLRQSGRRVVLAAGDTFRAAAIEQLQVWGQRAGAEVVAHQQGADAGAVVYDAYQAARARGADALIVDTAGRLHTKVNLMEELRKVHRVIQRLDPAAPHLTLLVLDATTGHNGLAQARVFTEAVGVNGVFLAKLDGTAKGGIVLAIARELRLPILFIGTGERLDDLAVFDPHQFAAALFAPLAEAGA